MPRDYTLGEANLVISDLCENRNAALELLQCGPTFRTLFLRWLAEVTGLPLPLSDRRPKADDLDEEDDFFDALGHAIHLYLGACQRHPKLSARVKEAAGTLRTVFIPRLRLLTASYSTEASTAVRLLPLLEVHRAELELFPVPVDAGEAPRTLYDWVKAWLDSGVRIDGLLRQRADSRPVTEGSRRGTELRTSGIKLLNQLRDNVAVELEARPELPRDLDTRLFGYYDELALLHSAPIRKEG